MADHETLLHFLSEQGHDLGPISGVDWGMAIAKYEMVVAQGITPSGEVQKAVDILRGAQQSTF